ncbi:MAG: cob(I)yrinic acid a,c-diamide adenosyltransferase [Candidatus Cloacimonetes bacterium]|nr:cob(I)yrinic acid a,c-diamide adenosyltransferase [Candidatus Cloacimonadota bacterium]
MSEAELMKGYIHIYTGNGKGKTTAAFGLALRAAGAGRKIFIAQFAKGMTYLEIEAVRKFIPSITIKQYGLDCFIINSPTSADIEIARKGISELQDIVSGNHYNMVIMDEINIALYYNLFSVETVINLLAAKPEEMEIILTGRYAPSELIELADLVTDMQELKHYYRTGVEARKGIEF